MSHLYHWMEKAIQEIILPCPTTYYTYLNIIDSRWDTYLSRELHKLSLLLCMHQYLRIFLVNLLQLNNWTQTTSKDKLAIMKPFTLALERVIQGPARDPKELFNKHTKEKWCGGSEEPVCYTILCLYSTGYQVGSLLSTGHDTDSTYLN